MIAKRGRVRHKKAPSELSANAKFNGILRKRVLLLRVERDFFKGEGRKGRKIKSR